MKGSDRQATGAGLQKDVQALDANIQRLTMAIAIVATCRRLGRPQRQPRRDATISIARSPRWRYFCNPWSGR